VGKSVGGWNDDALKGRSGWEGSDLTSSLSQNQVEISFDPPNSYLDS
jgi:hypothetical protein